MPDGRQFEIRKFQPEDRADVRRLCCETGFLGNPIDPVFEDRELFADYLTAYYTDWEPESSFVLVVDGEIKGYLLGSRFPTRQQLYNIYQNVSILSRGLLRYSQYNVASRAFVKWVLATVGAKSLRRLGVVRISISICSPTHGMSAPPAQSWMLTWSIFILTEKSGYMGRWLLSRAVAGPRCLSATASRS